MVLWSLNGPEGHLWSVSDVAKHFGWSRSTLYRLIDAGLFPRGRNVGGRMTWTGEDIAAYLLLAGRWEPKDAPKIVGEKEA